MIGERRKGERQKVTAISHTNFLVLKEAYIRFGEI